MARQPRSTPRGSPARAAEGRPGSADLPFQVVELLVGDGQGVAAGQQHVADIRERLDVAESLLPLPGRELVIAAGHAPHAREGAAAAAGRAKAVVVTVKT